MLSWPSEQFDSTTFVSGHPPSQDGEVVVNKQLADDNHLKVGQKVGLATSVGVKQVTLVGVYTLGGATSLGGATIVGTTFHDAQQWYDRVGKASTVNVLAEPGVSPVALRDRIQKVVGSGVRVETGQQSADRQTSEVAGSINGFLTRCCSRSRARRCSSARSSSSTPSRSRWVSAHASSRCCAPSGPAAARCCGRCSARR